MSTIADRRKKSGMNDAMVTQRLHQLHLIPLHFYGIWEQS